MDCAVSEIDLLDICRLGDDSDEAPTDGQSLFSCGSSSGAYPMYSDIVAANVSVWSLKG